LFAIIISRVVRHSHYLEKTHTPQRCEHVSYLSRVQANLRVKVRRGAFRTDFVRLSDIEGVLSATWGMDEEQSHRQGLSQAKRAGDSARSRCG